MAILAGMITSSVVDTELKFTDIGNAQKRDIIYAVENIEDALSKQISVEGGIPFKTDKCQIDNYGDQIDITINVVYGVPATQVDDQKAFIKESNKKLKQVIRNAQSQITKQLHSLASLDGILADHQISSVTTDRVGGNEYYYIGLSLAISFVDK